MEARDGIGLKISNDTLQLIDQTWLPHTEQWLTITDTPAMIEAIHGLKVRGAPMIGIAAALFLATKASAGAGADSLADDLARLRGARPTAVNLFWALDLMKRVLDANSGASNRELYELLRDAAHRLREEDVAICKRIGQHGAGDGSRYSPNPC